MSAGTPGRREGIAFPILLPIVVTVLVVAMISGLGLTLLGAAESGKLVATFVALVVSVVIMGLCTFVYVLGERKEQAHE